MSFHQLLSILLARWKVAAAVFLAIVGTTAAVSLAMEKKYTATASVLVDVKPDPVSTIMFGGLTNPGYMATQVDVMESPRVAQRVVRNLRFAENPQVREQWQQATGGEGSLEVWLGENFQRSLTVKPSRDSNVIEVSYLSPDSRFASALANAFVQAYLDTTVELRVEPAKQYSSFFDSRAKEARDVLEKAQAKVSAFQQQKGIIASDERLDIENSRLNELSTQLVMVQAAAVDSGSRQAQARGDGALNMQEVLNNGLIASLKADVARGEAKLQELNSRLGDRHPQVVEARASLAELRQRIGNETARVTASVGVTNNINRQRENEIRAALEAQRAKVLKMKEVRDEGVVLLRDVENAQRAYDAVQTRLTQSSLESQATQANVHVLAPATAPLYPSSPKVGLNTLVAAVLGGALALGLALLVELFDRRVRSPEDLVQILDLPVIGLLPKRAALGFWRRHRGTPMQQRVLHSLPRSA